MSTDKELNIKVLFASLAQNGIVKVEINFDGAGDSGSIEDTKCYIDDPDAELGRSVTENPKIITDALVEELTNLGYHILNQYYSYDWYNNDGGYGTINIDIKEKNWDIEGWQRVSDIEEANESGELEEALKSFAEN